MMAERIMPLARTVFLPKGSPGMCNVREIKADIGRVETSCEGGKIFCSGELDLLIEYLSFAGGEHYPGYSAYEQRLPEGESMWQALLSLPFELREEGDLPCPPLAELKIGRLKWFMVSPHALEMELELCLSWQEARPEQKAEQQPEQPTRIKVLLGGERLAMEKEDKIIHMGVSDQGWLMSEPEEAGEPLEERILPEPPLEERILPEPPLEERILPEPPLEEQVEECLIEELVIMATLCDEEPMPESAPQSAPEPESVPEPAPAPEPAPRLVIQTLETPWQPEPPRQPELAEGILAGLVAEAQKEDAQPPKRQRAAGLPCLKVRQQQISISGTYQVNFQIEKKQP